MRARILVIPALLIASTAVLGLACGGGSGDGGSPPTAVPTTDPPASAEPEGQGHAAGDLQDVTVTVGQPNEFNIESSITTFKVGVTYHFAVINKGSLAHEMMLMPVVAPGTITMTQMDEMALGMVEEEDLVPGRTESFDVVFSDADVGKKLELACHVPGHYEAGMHTPIQVVK